MKKTLLPLVLLTFSLACNEQNEKRSGIKDSAAIDEPDTRVEKKPADNKRSIVGIWKPTDVSMKNMTESDRQEFLDNATIEFTDDGEFITEMNEDKTSGTYFLNEKKGILKTRDSDGKEETLDMEWDKDQLILTNNEGTVTLKRQRDGDEGDDKGDSGNSLTGKWKFLESSDDKENKTYESAKATMTIEFKRDGRYINYKKFTGYGEDFESSEKGNYTFNERKKKLVTISDDDDEETMDVKFIGKNKVIFTDSDGESITMVRMN